MSPPCQPFTRQGRQAGLADARCKSFVYVTQLLKRMKVCKAKYTVTIYWRGYKDIYILRNHFNAYIVVPFRFIYTLDAIQESTKISFVGKRERL